MADDIKAPAAADSPETAALRVNKANLEARIKALKGARDSEHDEGHQLAVLQIHLDEVNKALGAK